MPTSSSAGKTALSIRDLGKSYQVSRQQATTLAESMADWVGRARGSRKETFWALQHATFEVPKGEIVGLVGRNGAGKSTLLKIIAGVTSPTTGSADVYGRIGSMLEVGTGFHPELTGRENVYLNGAFIGMRRAEIRARFDEIVEFSGVERFLDMPIKRYSSGMVVRLAFAVAAHLDADILLVDEVLAVGDQAFQDKCLGKIRDVRQKEGRTVLFVSHNLAAVSSICSRALLLSGGHVIADASASEITRIYTAGVAMATTTEEVDLTSLPRTKTGPARCTTIRVGAVDSTGTVLDAIIPGSTLEVVVGVHASAPVLQALIGVEVMDERGRPALGISTDVVDGWIDLGCRASRAGGRSTAGCSAAPGHLYDRLAVHDGDRRARRARCRRAIRGDAGAERGYERWPGWPAAAYAPRFDVTLE